MKAPAWTRMASLNVSACLVSLNIHIYSILKCILAVCPSNWTAIGDTCFSPPRKTYEWIDSNTDSNTYCETNCDPIMKLCTDDGSMLATKDETQAWIDNGGDRMGMFNGLTSTMSGTNHWFTNDDGVGGNPGKEGNWYAGCCHHKNRFFVCAKKAG